MVRRCAAIFILFFVPLCSRVCAECASCFAGGRCGRRGLFRDGHSRFAAAARTAARRQNLHQPRRPFAAGDRPWSHGRPAASPARRLHPSPSRRQRARLGQVFSLALDDANPPNIYAAASSAYGLPIVVPDADGDGVPDRSRRGAPNAAFMPGLFGPITLDGGPGSIWKIDGSTGAVTLVRQCHARRRAEFRTGARRARVRSRIAPALRRRSRHRLDPSLHARRRRTRTVRSRLAGAERGRLAADRLRSAQAAEHREPDISTAAIPATWAYAPPARRVFGMAVNGGRLYYAVAAGLRIWSVSLLPDGSFGPDARGEVSVPRGALPNSEVSEILFDDNGDMLVAERGAPTGAYDYKALAESPENRVLRFRPKTPERSAQPRSLVSGAEGICHRLPADFSQRQWRHRHRLRL